MAEAMDFVHTATIAMIVILMDTTDVDILVSSPPSIVNSPTWTSISGSVALHCAINIVTFFSRLVTQSIGGIRSLKHWSSASLWVDMRPRLYDSDGTYVRLSQRELCVRMTSRL
jgi:hypothetical protein